MVFVENLDLIFSKKIMDEKKFKEECKKSARLTVLFSHFSDIASGVSGSPKKTPKINSNYINDNLDIKLFYEKHKTIWGKFDHHYYSSIPYILEAECRLGVAILNYRLSKNNTPFKINTLGTAEATFARTLGLMGNGGIKTLSNSPNIQNKNNFYSYGKPKNSFFYLGGCFDIDKKYLKNTRYFKTGFDLIFEDTAFQMYSKKRTDQISYVSNNLKNNGLLVLLEKLNHRDSYMYDKMELLKDNLKKEYFSEEQIKYKYNIIDVMKKNQITLEETSLALKKSFKFVALYWNSCNFYGFLASNSESNISTFLSGMPPAFVNDNCRVIDFPIFL